MKKERNSSFELLRLCAQFFIVLYHMLLFLNGAQFVNNTDILSNALWIPLHIGVPVFVIISGYWGIRPSINGLLKLLITVSVYFIPLMLIRWYLEGGGNFRDFLIISNSRYWFIRTYIYLYLLSPILNNYLSKSGKTQTIYLLITLSFINVYIGLIGNDTSIQDGKNLANFSLMYVLGATLHRYSYKWEKIKPIWFLVAFVILNLSEMIVWSLIQHLGIGNFFWRTCFNYNGLLLMVNSILFICFIANRIEQHPIINRIAKSSFAIYLIHCHGLFVYHLHVPIVQLLSDKFDMPFLLFMTIFGYAILVFFACILIDQLLMPLWNAIGRLLKRVPEPRFQEI